MKATLFDRLGGFGAVSRIVLGFYERVMLSDVLAPYFEQADMSRLIDHQTKFIASLMGGPASYDDATLQRVHAGLAITDDAFDEMADILEETLEDFDVGEDDIAAVMREIQRRRRLVVTA